MNVLSPEAIKEHRIRKARMFGGGKSIQVLQDAGFFGPRTMSGGGSVPAPNGSFVAPPPQRYDPITLNTTSKPPGPQ
jgi:hypothetical protein